MKILFVNWAWYPTGGDWTYIKNVRKLYETNGFDIIPFSTLNEKNELNGYENYFVHAYDFKEMNKNKNFTNGIKVLKTSIISQDAISKLNNLLEAHKDIKIAHLHNIHHYITVSIVELLYKKGIKIMWTLHDFKIICPENSFMSNGKLCEKCITGEFYHCAINRCKKKSILASSLASVEAYYYHKNHSYEMIDYYLCPSAFMMNKFLQFGFKESKMTVVNSCYDITEIDNFISANESLGLTNNKEKYILYIGRLENIKGVHTLIDAVKDTNMKLKILGTGLEEEKLKNMAIGHDNIEFLGFKNKTAVFKLIIDSFFVVCPSICYENLPFSVIESFLFSKPVIGAEIGGIPELVIDGKTGLLFEAGNAAHLCEKMRYLWDNGNIVDELGKSARIHAFNMVNFSTHWSKLQFVLNKLT